MGAGASIKYGLPSGPQLREKILSHKVSNEDVKNLIKYKYNEKVQSYSQKDRERFYQNFFERENSIIRDEFRKFKDKFKASFLGSIDSFLSKEFDLIHEPLQPIVGKYLIVSEITKAQGASLGSLELGWIGQLIGQYVDPDYKVFFKKPPKIITFNYDTLIETHLKNYLVSKQNLELVEAQQLVDSLQIVHVYGKIDTYALTDITPKDIVNIKIMGNERVDVDPKIREYVNLASQGGRLYVIGFSYDKQNCKVLFSGTTSSSSNRVLFSTFYEQFLEEVKEGLKSVGPNFELAEEKNFGYGTKFSAEQILRKYPLLHR